jgi:dTDP-4-amino-4,6-dideoxygalactose transaminase
MVVTRDADLAERLRQLRTYGERARYDSVRKGFNSRLDELQAAILLAKLPHLAEWNRRRREIAAAYREGLAGTDVVLPTEATGRYHVYHLFVLRARDRAALQTSLRERGVVALVHYSIPVHAQAAYAELQSEAPFLTETERATREVLSLPVYPELTDEDIAWVITATREALA